MSLFACHRNLPIYSTRTSYIRQGVWKQIEFDVLSVCVYIWRLVGLSFSFHSDLILACLGILVRSFVRLFAVLESFFLCLCVRFSSLFHHHFSLIHIDAYCFYECVCNCVSLATLQHYNIANIVNYWQRCQ